MMENKEAEKVLSKHVSPPNGIPYKDFILKAMQEFADQVVESERERIRKEIHSRMLKIEPDIFRSDLKGVEASSKYEAFKEIRSLLSPTIKT